MEPVLTMTPEAYETVLQHEAIRSPTPTPVLLSPEVFDVWVETLEGDRLVEGKDYVVDLDRGVLRFMGIEARRCRVVIAAGEPLPASQPGDRRFLATIDQKRKQSAQWKRETQRRFR